MIDAVMEDVRNCLNRMEESECKLERQQLASRIRIRVDRMFEKLTAANESQMNAQELAARIKVFEAQLKR